MRRLIRQWIRQHYHPLPADVANSWKTRLTLVYAFVAWNAFGYVIYTMFTRRKRKLDELAAEKGPSEVTPADKWRAFYKPTSATYVHISGLSKISVWSEADKLIKDTEEESTSNT